MTFGSAVSLALFAVLILAVSLQLLAASGHFPLQARRPAMKGAAAGLLLWLSIAITLAALIAGVLAGWEHLPWQGLVIVAGLAVLAAPVALQQFPEHFVDGRAALVTFAAGAAASALLLVVAAAQ
jgi:hypothetical protein